LTLSLMLAIVPWTQAGTDESPFVKVMAATHVPYAAGVINFVLLIAALSAMNSQLYVTTRMMFSLSRARLAPAVFGRLGTNGVTRAELWISTNGMMAIAMFGALFTWLMIFVTHLRFRSRYRGPALAFRMWGHPFGSLLGAGLVAAILFTTAFTREFRMTMVVGVVFVVLLTLAYALHYRHQHAR
jgi:amino acid transporter, AAT family